MPVPTEGKDEDRLRIQLYKDRKAITNLQHDSFDPETMGWYWEQKFDMGWNTLRLVM